MRDILEGLKHIHRCGIVHADIKVENILAFEPPAPDEFPVLKIIDFGLSQRLDKSGKVALAQKIGTIGYMAPEFGSAEVFDAKIDMWSVGIVFYEMAAGYKPTAVKGYKYDAGPIPFGRDWNRKHKDLKSLIT